MILSAALAVLLSAQPAQPAKPFEFKDGNRVVWLGNTLVEREQRYGYWETALLAANADKTITLRNLGWSGDTVFGEARVGFDLNQPNKGFERMVSLTLELKPTVIFIAYGTNESFEGKDGLPKFEKGLEKLLDALKPAKARIVLFTPMRFEKSPSLPDTKSMNEKLGLYRESIKAIAEKRDHYFADLYEEIGKVRRAVLKESDPGQFFTDNGMHLTQEGYSRTDVAFLVTIGCKTSAIEKVVDLKKSDHEALRKAVITKNELFFHRWRPQNETYLFGFRKHEQGKNAKEVAEFDPLVAKAEEEIIKLRKELTK
jgi:lysophospholipase L1-like esterase